jgi:hypothetical protein
MKEGKMISSTRQSPNHIWELLRVAVVASVVLSSCGLLFQSGETQRSGEEEAGEEGIPLDEFDLSDEGSLESEGLDISVEGEVLSCPDEKQLYILMYSHLLTVEGPGFSFREENKEEGAYFQIFIYPDGHISSEGLYNSIAMVISGSSEDCALDGSSDITARITGTCQGNQAMLDIVEQHENFVLYGQCPEGQVQLVEQWILSAPEETHTFRLFTGGDDHVLSYDAGVSAAIYSWTLLPAEGLGLVPLVPED